MNELHSQHDRNKTNTATEWPISGRVSGLCPNYYASTIGCNAFPQSLALWFPPCQEIHRWILNMFFEVSSAVDMTLKTEGRCPHTEHLLTKCAQSPSKQYRDYYRLWHAPVTDSAFSYFSTSLLKSNNWHSVFLHDKTVLYLLFFLPSPQGGRLLD